MNTSQDITPELANSFGLKEPNGALVADVTKNGPADNAGIQRGDVITVFNGTTIRASRDLPSLVAQTTVGTKVDVVILRDGRERTVTVTLGKLAEQQAKAEGGSEAGWGMTVANVTPETRNEFQLQHTQTGVVVTDVEAGSPADTAGLRSGDVIEEVNRQPVTAVDDFTTALASGKDTNTLLLLVRRGENALFVVLQQAS